MAIRVIPGKGLEFDMDHYVRLRTYVGGPDYWYQDNQRVLRSKLHPFLPEMSFNPENNTVLASLVEDGVEWLSQSCDISEAKSIPTSERKRLEDILTALKKEVESGSKDANTSKLIREFKLPDHTKAPEMYRIFTKGHQRRLAIIWGMEKENAASVPVSMLSGHLDRTLPTKQGCSGGTAFLIGFIAAVGVVLYLYGCDEDTPAPGEGTHPLVSNDTPDVFHDSGMPGTADETADFPADSSADFPANGSTGETSDTPADASSGVVAGTPSVPSGTPAGDASGIPDVPAKGASGTPDAPADGASDAAPDTPANGASDTPNSPADEVGDTPADTPAENTGDTPADTPADGASDTPNKPADATGDTPADIPADETGNTPADTPAENTGDTPDTPAAEATGAAKSPQSLSGAEKTITLPDSGAINECITPAVYLVKVRKNGQLISTGTAFCVSPDGKFITNAHVAKEFGKPGISYELVSHKGATLKVAACPWSNADKDLAILTSPAADLAFLKLDRQNKPKVGDPIYIKGFPQGIDNFTEGKVSGLSEYKGNLIVRHPAPTSPGSSGSPIVRPDAAVTAVVIGAFEGGQNLNVAIWVGDLPQEVLKQPTEGAVQAPTTDAAEDSPSPGDAPAGSEEPAQADAPSTTTAGSPDSASSDEPAGSDEPSSADPSSASPAPSGESSDSTEPSPADAPSTSPSGSPDSPQAGGTPAPPVKKLPPPNVMVTASSMPVEVSVVKTEAGEGSSCIVTLMVKPKRELKSVTVDGKAPSEDGTVQVTVTPPASVEIEAVTAEGKRFIDNPEIRTELPDENDNSSLLHTHEEQ